MAAQLAADKGLAGVGCGRSAWTAPTTRPWPSALDGNAPAQKDSLAGPTSTSTSPSKVELAPLKADAAAPTSAVSAGGDDHDNDLDASLRQLHLRPTRTPAIGPERRHGCCPTVVPKGHRISEGSMIEFTDGRSELVVPRFKEPTLNVFFYVNDPTHDYVVARKGSGDCANAAFVFVPPADALPPSSSGTSGTSGTTTTTTTTPQNQHTTTRSTGDRHLHLCRDVAGSADAARLPSADPGPQGTPIGIHDRLRHRRSESVLSRQRNGAGGVSLRHQPSRRLRGSPHVFRRLCQRRLHLLAVRGK